MTDVPTNDVPRVLVIGEALVDIVRSQDGVREFPGGSPLNVAYGLARLGIPTTLQTRIGRDRHGELIREHLAAAGVELWPGSEGAPRTSTAIARLGDDGAASYEFDIRWDVEPIGAPAFRAVHAGSIAAFLEPGARAVRETLAAASSTALVTFDPNIRAALVGSRESALATFAETVRLADVVKLSDEDAEWLYPEADDVDAVLQRVLDLGATLAVCTLGAAGARLRTQELAVGVPAVQVQVADTIGAGDSFMSCLIAELLRQSASPGKLGAEELDAVGRAAVRAAAITVSRPGAQPPSAEELA
ncbi:MAG: carbohydrate kinase, partial [Actinomycetota bacterium]|nr:carbohydrate kinase [Actinomycetota bacterium]